MSFQVALLTEFLATINTFEGFRSNDTLRRQNWRWLGVKNLYDGRAYVANQHMSFPTALVGKCFVTAITFKSVLTEKQVRTPLFSSFDRGENFGQTSARWLASLMFLNDALYQSERKKESASWVIVLCNASHAPWSWIPSWILLHKRTWSLSNGRRIVWSTAMR